MKPRSFPKQLRSGSDPAAVSILGWSLWKESSSLQGTKATLRMSASHSWKGWIMALLMASTSNKMEPIFIGKPVFLDWLDQTFQVGKLVLFNTWIKDKNFLSGSKDILLHNVDPLPCSCLVMWMICILYCKLFDKLKPDLFYKSGCKGSQPMPCLTGDSLEICTHRLCQALMGEVFLFSSIKC